MDLGTNVSKESVSKPSPLLFVVIFVFSVLGLIDRNSTSTSESGIPDFWSRSMKQHYIRLKDKSLVTFFFYSGLPRLFTKILYLGFRERVYKVRFGLLQVLSGLRSNTSEIKIMTE